MKKPQEFMDALPANPWNYKLKGVGEPKYHLGGDFFHDNDGCPSYGAQTYVKHFILDYFHLFDEDPVGVTSSLPKGDHSELDESEPCGPNNTAKLQSLIGALQWTISFCRLEIANDVMTLSHYRAGPLQGHLEHVKGIVGYLKKFPHAAIHFCTGIPNQETIYGEDPVAHNWMHSVYGTTTEEIPHYAPKPKGKIGQTTTFVDANLMHEQITGRSATGCLHLLNQTPLGRFSKRQGQVEMATYGSEFVAANTAVEQIIDLRFTLRMLGIPLDGPAWLFPNNQSTITSSTIPHSTLSKHWNALSYHCVHEAIPAGSIRLHLTQPLSKSLTSVSPSVCWVSHWMAQPGYFQTTRVPSQALPFPTPPSPSIGMHCPITVFTRPSQPAPSGSTSLTASRIPPTS